MNKTSFESEHAVQIAKPHEQYLAILFACDVGTTQTLSLSRNVSTDDCKEVFDYMCAESGMAPDNVDTILLVKNGSAHEPPVVHKFWTAANADFDFDGEFDEGGEEDEA